MTRPIKHAVIVMLWRATVLVAWFSACLLGAFACRVLIKEPLMRRLIAISAGSALALAGLWLWRRPPEAPLVAPPNPTPLEEAQANAFEDRFYDPAVESRDAAEKLQDYIDSANSTEEDKDA